MTVDVVVGPRQSVSRRSSNRPTDCTCATHSSHPYRLFPVADQIADKVCATMSTAYAGGKRSSRVKDLVDLVILAHSQTVDLAALRAAITTKQRISGMDPFDHFDIPAEWRRTYPATPKGVPSVEAYTTETAAALIAAFVAPALAKSSNPGIWDRRTSGGVSIMHNQCGTSARRDSVFRR